ncbi:hypothetical protein VPH35_028545 [Triticum aestivum]
MAEEPSAKRHHGDTSNKSSNLADVHVPGEKHEYTRMLKGVELHGKETPEIVCTSEPDKADQMMSSLRMKRGGLPKRLKDFLQEEKLYTFVGLSIRGDKRKLGESGLEISPNNFIDMQRKSKDPKTNKYYDCLTDVAGGIIHPFYEGMKKKMKREDHKLGDQPAARQPHHEADPYYHCNFADEDA